MTSSGNFFSKFQEKLGIRTSNKALYKEAFTHRSLNLKNAKGEAVNFERLEFLGDALLTSIVAEYLFQYYPLAKEGALTKLRAKIVSRVKLNQIGKEMGLFELAQISNHHKNFGDDIHGNLLESLIGALFIDRGYEKTKNYVIKKIILPNVDMERLESLVLSYKAFLIEWGQKQKKEIQFITEEDAGVHPKISYTAQIFLDREPLVKSKALSKKKAEEKAARIAARILKINPKPLNS
ncbi:MAG: putative dsRNA-binding protein [Flavobacteriaceae bacterium]|nr:putative dsRNA-binding protein [Flavobacteriaceae bacterium]